VNVDAIEESIKSRLFTTKELRNDAKSCFLGRRFEQVVAKFQLLIAAEEAGDLDSNAASVTLRGRHRDCHQMPAIHGQDMQGSYSGLSSCS
jgi:hypothetical protein